MERIRALIKQSSYYATDKFRFLTNLFKTSSKGFELLPFFNIGRETMFFSYGHCVFHVQSVQFLRSQTRSLEEAVQELHCDDLKKLKIEPILVNQKIVYCIGPSSYMLCPLLSIHCELHDEPNYALVVVVVIYY